MPLVIVPALLLVLRVHPDPRDIAAELERYYPEYRPERRETSEGGMRGVFRNYACWTAFLGSAAAWGVMSMMMAITSLVMEHHGHPLPAISLTVAIHVIGMFGLSLPLGRLADRLGRQPVMVLGLAMTAGGALMVPLTPHYLVITAGLFIVGLGWSAAIVAATALLADVTAPEERAQAVGINDGLGSAAAAAMSFLGAPSARHGGTERWGLYP